MYYEDLRLSIKEGKILPLYIFEGEEDYLIEFCIDELKKKLIEPWSEMMNYKSWSELPEVSEAGDFLETLPVMSERKFVVFRKCGLFTGNIKNKAQWENLFSSVADFNCVVIWEELPEKGKKPTSLRTAAEKNAEVVKFPLRSEANLKTWITRIAAANQKSIDARTASYLAASLDRKMRAIKTELDKIIAYSKSGQITRADIDAVIVKPVDESVFKLIDAIFEGRRDVCFNLLYTLRMLKNEPVSLLSLLSGQIILIYKAKLYIMEGMTAGSAAAKMGGGFLNEKCAAKANKTKVENIEHLIFLCTEADKNIKQGKIGAWTALETITAEYKI